MADKDQSRRNQLRHQKAARTQENIQKLRQRTQHIAFDLTLRVAIYARQSTFIQMERNEQSFEDQTEGQRKRALALGWREDQIDVITVDMDYTATTDIDDREGLSELLHQIKQGVYGAVIAYMEDRLFRDEFLDNATRFARACATNNCYLITERYTYDLSDEMERERFLMEVRFGWREQAHSGWRPPRHQRQRYLEQPQPLHDPAARRGPLRSARQRRGARPAPPHHPRAAPRRRNYQGFRLLSPSRLIDAHDDGAEGDDSAGREYAVCVGEVGRCRLPSYSDLRS